MYFGFGIWTTGLLEVTREWISGSLLLKVRGAAFEGQKSELSKFSLKHPHGWF